MTVSFIKDKPKSKEYKPLTPKIALDLGLKSIFTTDRDDLFDRKFYETLLKYDGIITELACNRQKQGLNLIRIKRWESLYINLLCFT